MATDAIHYPRYRTELPRPIPERILKLHVSRGYPVPWFVTWLKDGEQCERGDGEPDFRIITPDAIATAVLRNRCWVCGQRLGKHMAFVLGPMCAVNLNSAEPPSHLECADWSARACPFLTRPHMRRNEKPVAGELAIEDMDSPAGVMLKRNPGVALVWITANYRTYSPPGGGVLFRIGRPTATRWYCEGREATRAEVEESIDSGIPALAELCQNDGELAELARQVVRARELLPA